MSISLTYFRNKLTYKNLNHSNPARWCGPVKPCNGLHDTSITNLPDYQWRARADYEWQPWKMDTACLRSQLIPFPILSDADLTVGLIAKPDKE